MTAPIGRLHVIVDSVPVAEAALAGGARLVQVRCTAGTDRQRYVLATEVARRCAASAARCVVDDRFDIALAARADGVHLGAHDLPVAQVRRVCGPNFVIGGTARDPATALRLQASGADYIGAGPVYATASKTGLPAPLGVAAVARIARAVAVPVVAIGGVTVDRVAELRVAGVFGVAVIGAVARAADPCTATAELAVAVRGDSAADTHAAEDAPPGRGTATSRRLRCAAPDVPRTSRRGPGARW